MIEVNGLTKYYGNFRAVNGISFKTNDGEITGLLGPNGAGKTTTMRMITGYLVQSAGTILIGGKQLSEDPVAVKKTIGYLPESAPLYADMLVYDYMRYAAEMHGITNAEARIAETAALCGLNEVMHMNIGELSKGYRQRVGLAHAMIHDPAILILDEPTSGLDPNQILEIRALIREIGRRKTVIISTHIMQEVEAICDRVIIINRGNIVADSKTADLRSSSKRIAGIRVGVQGVQYGELESAMRSVSGVQNVVKVDDPDGLASCMVTAPGDVRADIFQTVKAKGWTLCELTREQNTLEQVFRDLTIGGGE